MPSTQTDVAKKIQAKLRVRRATGSQKRIQKQTAERLNISDKLSEDTDPIAEFEQKVDHLWENSEEVSEVVNSFANVINGQSMKEKLLKECGVLQCQSAASEMESVIVARLKKIGEMAKTMKRCTEHE